MAALSIIACVETDGEDEALFDRGDREAAAFASTGDGSLYWLKEDPWWNALGGATFEICRTHDESNGALSAPLACRSIEDNGPYDVDGRDGVVLVENLMLGTWTIQETKAPPGYVVDPHDIQTVVLTTNTPNGEAAREFMNELAGSLRWSKEDEHWELLGGATFEACLTKRWDYDTEALVAMSEPACFEVEDNGPGDADPRDGVFVIEGVRLGHWEIAEKSAPPGYMPVASVHTVVLTPEVRDDPEAEAFMNLPAGRLRWFKEDHHWNPLGGATFRVCRMAALTMDDTTMTLVMNELSEPWDCFEIKDNDSLDGDPADGTFKVEGLELGKFRIQETKAPEGFLLDPRAQYVVLTVDYPHGQPERAFLDLPGGRIKWHKVNGKLEPLGGATFRVCRMETYTMGDDMNTVVNVLPQPECFAVKDNGPGDYSPHDGTLVVEGVELGKYSVTETEAPVGYLLDDTPRFVTLTIAEPRVVIDGPFINRHLRPGACTLGFYKNHVGQWDGEGKDMCTADFDRCTDFHTYFDLTAEHTGLPHDLTMLEALQLGGGQANNLARQGVAALLNVCAPYAYPYFHDGEVLRQKIHQAFVDQDWKLGDHLDYLNNSVECRLDGSWGKTPRDLKQDGGLYCNGVVN